MGTTTFKSNIVSKGTLAVTGAATLSSTLAVTGNATVGGTLGVTGAATLASAAITGAATVGTTLGVTGATTCAAVTASGLITANAGVTLGSAQTLTVPADGFINVATGGQIKANGTQASLISDVPTAGSADAAANATAINSILDILEGIGAMASS